jgi:hypothetical protein
MTSTTIERSGPPVAGSTAGRRQRWQSSSSNKPFEWTGHHQLSASPPQALCLPLKGSVRRTVLVRMRTFAFNRARSWSGHPT